eukprot:SAG22_NODE_4662_length_1201_cov_0.999093_1_plen_74_part_10
MGPTAILPGSTYCTVSREDERFDCLGDRLEDHLNTPPPGASGPMGSEDLGARDAALAVAERLAVDELGATGEHK